MKSRSPLTVCSDLVRCSLVMLAISWASLQPGMAQSPPSPAVSGSPVVPSLLPARSPVGLELDTQLWGTARSPVPPSTPLLAGDRRALLKALEYSLRYLASPKATADYRKLAIPGFTLDRVRRSVERFRRLVTTARSPAELQAAVERDFTLFQATGKDGQGSVAFTGYFEPVQAASRVPTKDYRYPIFRLPIAFFAWKKPHPTRAQLEGTDGLQYGKSALNGRELVWLRDRLEAFLVQVQGSARLKLTDGSTMTIGYAGHTDYPYTGIGRQLVQDGKLKLDELTLPKVIEYFKQHPAELDQYLPRNQRFVFFGETGGAPALGSLGVPVTPERSIATDKSLFPPGALAVIQAEIPYPSAAGKLESRRVTRYVLDQDTGGAIKGAGRVDIFMGTGKSAGDRAGLINSTGQLYYLILK